MSNFKLDFDISTHRRPAPRKTCVSTSAAVAPEDCSANRVCLDRKAESPAVPGSPPRKETNPAGSLPAVPLKVASLGVSLQALSIPSKARFIFALIVAFAISTYLLVNLYVLRAPTKRGVTISRCNVHNNAVTCQSACELRGNCRTPQIVSFATKQCADGVHTVHLHSSGEGSRRVPAFYLRVPNTSMFEFTGDRGIFRPAACKAEIRNVVLRTTPKPTQRTLSGYLWWVSGKQAVRFNVMRGTKVVAELDASVVLQRCYSSTHCVFKLPMDCGVAKKAHVLGQTSLGQKKAETFVFC